MSMLVILLPTRPPLTPRRDGEAGPGPARAGESAAATTDDDDSSLEPAELDTTPWAYALSHDGQTLAHSGLAAAMQLPRAEQVLAVVPAECLSWHRLTLPKAPSSRLREALAGVLEEQLLDDSQDLHLALQPRPVAGAPVWVAALSRRWLLGHLQTLRSAGVQIDRVLPACAPVADGQPALLHFVHDDNDAPDAIRLWAADAQGVVCLPLAGSLAHARISRWAATATPEGLSVLDLAQISTTPAAAGAAERWLGRPVAVQTELEQALAASAGDWNLLQFDLAPSHRGTRAVGAWLRRLRAPEWRVARIGVAALVVVNLLGLNLWAWHQRNQLQTQRQAMDSLLLRAHPQVQVVLDAPVQMQRETDALRSAAGLPGPADFEPLLAALGRVWPASQPPLQQLRYEAGQLTVPAPGWSDAQLQPMRAQLAASGYALALRDGVLTLSAAPTGQTDAAPLADATDAMAPAVATASTAVTAPPPGSLAALPADPNTPPRP